MIQPAKYNGINFSYDFTRESLKYKFDNQRRKCLLNRNSEIKYLSFIYVGPVEPAAATLTAKSIGNADVVYNFDSQIDLITEFIVFFKLATDTLPVSDAVVFELDIEGEKLTSEICQIVDDSYVLQHEICELAAYNNDNRHGYLVNQAFGFFNYSKLKSDIFLTEKIEYEYSYSRKKILRAENQIAKRFIFHDLSMYQANLLKWLCNCENLSIDGISYQLISDFTEIESDANSEILSLQADFVEVYQSFFGEGSTKHPTDIFTNNFYM